VATISGSLISPISTLLSSKNRARASFKFLRASVFVSPKLEMILAGL